MAVVKLSTTAASCLYSRPYKWWSRHITTTTTGTPKPNITSSSSSIILRSSKLGWRLTPCAHLSSSSSNSAYVSNNKSTKGGLGFNNSYNNKCLCYYSTNSSSSSSNQSPTGSGIVADIGSDYNHNQTPPSMNHDHDRHSDTDTCSSKFLTLPTILTLARVAAVPIIITTFYIDTSWGRTATTTIFIAAAFTDWLDGYIARKMRLGSVFGAFLDPVADKLMVATTIILLCTKPLLIPMFGEVPWLLTVPAVAIIGREITMSAVREWAASVDSKLLEAVAVNNLGKWKTATQMIALTILLATRESSLANPGILGASGVALLYTSAGLSLWSLAVYMGKISKVLLK
ncbi:hypothetical protein ACFE04_003103 [Oxalis oulophora]